MHSVPSQTGDISPEQLKAIRASSPVDVALYELAVEKFDQRITLQSASFQSEVVLLERKHCLVEMVRKLRCHIGALFSPPSLQAALFLFCDFDQA